MSSYTQLVLSVSFNTDLPAIVKQGIDYLALEIDLPMSYPEHPLFIGYAWSGMLKHGSEVFPGSGMSKWVRTNGGWYKLGLNMSIKNYDKQLEKFLDWIAPYVDSGPKICGYIMAEDEELPILIKFEFGKVLYVKV